MYRFMFNVSFPLILIFRAHLRRFASFILSAYFRQQCPTFTNIFISINHLNHISSGRMERIITAMTKEKDFQRFVLDWGNIMKEEQFYCILLIISMRYNSLRPQLNWHSKQQTHILKKITKNIYEPQAQSPPQKKSQEKQKEDTKFKGNQLQWLQKMMKELQQYKRESIEKSHSYAQNQCQKGGENTKEKNLGVRPSSDKIQGLTIIGQQEVAKSVKKVKFQIVTGKQSKPSSTKKLAFSEPKNNNSKSKTITNSTSKKQSPKTQPKKTVTKDVKQNMNGPICPSNTKIVQIQQLKTDPYLAQELQKEIVQTLWLKQKPIMSEIELNSQKSVERLRSKKSVGKIIRNSQKLNKTCVQMINPQQQSLSNQRYNKQASNTICNSGKHSSYKQYKQQKLRFSISTIPPFQSKQYKPFESKQLQSDICHRMSQKNTQKFIKYDSNAISLENTKELQKKVRNNSKQQTKANKNNEIKQTIDVSMKTLKPKYEKVYIKLQTQKLSEYLTDNSRIKQQQQPQKKTIKTNEYQKYCQTIKARKLAASIQKTAQGSEVKAINATLQGAKQEAICKNEAQAPRSRSEQRKLNKIAQIRQTTNSYPQSSKIHNSSSMMDQPAKQTRGQIKLKRKYEYSVANLDNPTSAQKLFTLHSVSSQQSQKELIVHKSPQKVREQQSICLHIQSQAIVTPINITQLSKTITQKSPSPSSKVQEAKQSVLISPKKSILRIPQTSFNQIEDNQTLKTNCSDDLTMLFNYLDQNHRGLLTDSNCSYDSLTEQLKLLFSATLNQIRTKKKFFNLLKFIEQGKQILQIKNELYTKNNPKATGNYIAYKILKQNIQLLKRKSPLSFVKHTYTQSFYQSNIQSKKTSISDNRSIVIDRIDVQQGKTDKNIQIQRISNYMQQRNANQYEGRIKSYKKDASINKVEEKVKVQKENTQRQGSSPSKSYRKTDNPLKEIDILQPQIFLQRKYSISKRPQDLQQKSDRLSKIHQKTKGYLQNLDNYLKIR